MNAKTIIEKLIKALGPYNRGYGYEGPSLGKLSSKDLKDVGLADFQIIVEERCGDEYDEWIEIAYFKKYDIYIQHTGCYSSYGGIDFGKPSKNNLIEVKPVEVKKIEYRSVK